MACASLFKLLLIIINIVFMIISLALMAVGVILVFVVDVFLKSAFDAAKEAASTSGYTISGSASDLKDFPLLYEIGVALLVLGMVLFVLCLLACCGTCCTSCCRFLLLAFAILVIAIMLAEIVVFSLFLVKDSPLHKELKDQIKDKITSDYDENSGNSFTAAIIIINREGDCCGMEGVQDFGNKDHDSCDAANEKKGCYDEMQDVIKDNSVFVGLGVAAVLALQLIEVIGAIVVFKDAKSKIMPI